MNDQISRGNRVTLVPPNTQTISRFAQDVCQQLAADQGDPTLNDPQVVSSFAAFLGIIAEVSAKHLNKTQGESLDKPDGDR